MVNYRDTEEKKSNQQNHFNLWLACSSVKWQRQAEMSKEIAIIFVTFNSGCSDLLVEVGSDRSLLSHGINCLLYLLAQTEIS